MVFFILNELFLTNFKNITIDMVQDLKWWRLLISSIGVSSLMFSQYYISSKYMVYVNNAFLL